MFKVLQKPTTGTEMNEVQMAVFGLQVFYFSAKKSFPQRLASKRGDYRGEIFI
jgi:hypothetical protein